MKPSYDELEKRVLELEKIENEYKSNAEKYSVLFNQSPDGIALVSTIDASIIDFNNQLCTQLGYSREEFNNIRIRDIEVLESEEDTKRRIENILKNGKDCFETKQKTKSGEIRDVLVIVQKIKIGNDYYLHSIFRDITEQKKLEKTLERERELFSAGPVLTIEWDPTENWPIRSVSRNVVDILGFNIEEVRSPNFHYADLIHPDDLERIFDEVKFNIENHIDIYEQSYKLKTKSGEYRSFFDFTRLDRDSEGNLIGIRGYLFDQTEKKAIENELIANNKLLKKLSEQVPGVIYQYRYHSDGRSYFPFASDNIYDVYELSWEDVRDDASIVFKRIHPEDLENVSQSIIKSFETLELWEADFRVNLPERGVRWLRGIAKPEKMDDGSVLWHGYIADITERKNADIELQKVKEQFSLAVKGSNDGIWDWDLTTNKVYFSDRWKEIIGYEDNELENEFSTFVKLIHQEDLNGVQQYVNDYLAGNSTNYEIEFRMIHKDGSTRWILAKGEAIRNSHGVPYRMAGSHSDITDRKRQEEQVRKSELRFRKVFDESPDAYLIMDMDQGKILDCNKATEEMLGTVKENILHATPAQLSPEYQPNGKLSTELANEKIQNSIHKNKNRFEWLHKKYDGTEFWVDVSISVIDYDEQKALLVSWRDISDAKRAKEALQESEEKFRQITENLNQVVWLRNSENTRILYISPSYEKIWGRTCQSLYDHPESFMATIHEEDLPAVLDDYQRYVENQVFNREYRIIRPDGEIRWIHSQTYPVKCENGNIISHTGIATDITERKLAEQALKDSEERWKFAIDGSGDGLWDWDAETNKVFFSWQWKKMLGYFENEISDSLDEWKNRVHPDDWQSCLDDLNKHFKGESKIYSNVHRMLCKDGTYKWILDRGLVVEWLEDGTPKRVIGTHRDITAEKEFENEIKRLLDDISLANQDLAASLLQKNALIESLEETKLQLEESNSEKDKFFSIIAHDLRSPFNGFIGLTKVMVEDIEDLSIREFHEFSKALHDSAENLYKLLENLLTWSSVKRGSTNFKPEPFNLKESVDIAYHLQKVAIENKQQNIEIDVSPDIYVFGDSQMINTVIRNLLSNANKFTRKEGLIKISAREINDNIEISIADSGIGMPENILRNIFKLGEKTSRKGTDYESSSGLGLILCKEFIEKNNGKIWVESTEDVGTTFYFTLMKYELD